MNAYVARRRGMVGHGILADGEVMAWTVDGRWAATVVALLNGAEALCPKRLPKCPKAGNDPGGDVDMDTEATARKAISHLAYNGISLRWDFPGEPSDEVEKLVATYFSDGAIVKTLSDLACRYVMKALADDYLGITGIEIPETDSVARHGPHENSSVGA